jgi:hypothetical protein
MVFIQWNAPAGLANWGGFLVADGVASAEPERVEIVPSTRISALPAPIDFLLLLTHFFASGPGSPSFPMGFSSKAALPQAPVQMRAGI